jgi:hypothetical protein
MIGVVEHEPGDVVRFGEANPLHFIALVLHA